MNILKPTALWLSKTLFHLETSFFISATVVVMVFGSSATIKDIFNKSKAYEKLPDIVLSEANLQANNVAEGLNNKVLLDSAKTVLTPDKLKTYSENFIEGMYGWLSGKTTEPNFNIDYTDVKPVIAESIAENLVQKVSALPPCKKIPKMPIDVNNLDCLPPGINLQTEKQKAVTEIMASEDFLPNTTFTAEQLPKSSDGKSFSEQYKQAPEIFQFLKILPIILLIFGTVTAGLIYWLSSDKRKAINTVALALLINGMIVLITIVVINLLLPKFSETAYSKLTGETQVFTKNLVDIIVQKVVDAMLTVGGSVFTLGVLIFTANKKLKISKANKTRKI